MPPTTNAQAGIAAIALRQCDRRDQCESTRLDRSAPLAAGIVARIFNHSKEKGAARLESRDARGLLHEPD